MGIAEIKRSEPDYIHSSNALFNFMKEYRFIEDALLSKRLAPRYCEENIKYLNLVYNQNNLETIEVLQKCFCDIPIHRIVARFPLSLAEDFSNDNKELAKEIEKGNTHTDFYGEYGIAFSKKWAMDRNLQPVLYINEKSGIASQYANSFDCVSNQEDIDDAVAFDIISRLTYFKPLFGKMPRIVLGKKINVIKNFHDECEWRFVPKEEIVEKSQISTVIFDEETRKLATAISDRIADDKKYSELWLRFDYSDIRYLIVPNNEERNKLIELLINMEMESNQDRYLLISKVLVLEEIRKDF